MREGVITHCPLCEKKINEEYGGLRVGNYWGLINCCGVISKLFDGQIYFVLDPNPNRTWSTHAADENKMDIETLRRYAKLRSFE